MMNYNLKNRKNVFEYMKKTAIVIFLFLFIAQSNCAQSYRTAAGLRLGTGKGSGIALSVQQRVGKYSTIEGIYQPNINDSESALDLIYERHHKIIFKRFNIYTGGGLHKDWRPDNHENIDKAHFGMVGIMGGEITFKKLNVSWDYKPSYSVVGGPAHFSHDSAITLRVILVKQKKRKIKWKFWEKDKSRKERRQEKREDRKKEKEKKKKKSEKKSKWKFWENW